MQRTLASLSRAGRSFAAALALLLGLVALHGAPASAQLSATPGLSSITFLEVTGVTTPHPFAPNSAQLTTRLLNPLGPGNNDFTGVATEYYDVFYSDAAGAFKVDGDYITIECQFAGVGGLNIDEVHLDFGPLTLCACGVTNAVYLGNGQIPGSAPNAADCAPGSWSTMGSTSGTEERLALTLDACQDQCKPVPGHCCAGRPAFEDPLYSFTGQVAVGTATRSGGSGPVVTVYDFSPPTFAAPVGVNLPIGRYSDPSWNEGELGTVFGVTFDAAGNIYVTSSTAYTVDAVASGGPGAVYRIDRVTGAVTTFATLPNTGPALGNIVYDCEHDQFFVTNHEDGKIYRLSATGATLSTFDFAAADDGAPGFAPLGERLWGVTVNGGRVWFGVWLEDVGRPSALEDNEVWSVALDASGDFEGLERHEVTVPPLFGTIFSNPVSDLRFSPTGSMLIAERGMSSDTFPAPHYAEALEFVCDNGSWVPSANSFILGQFGRDCSGGIDFDFGPGQRPWWSTDAMSFPSPAIYGYQGVPPTGGTIANSYLLDYDGFTANPDKTFIGDIAISCSPCGLVTGVSTKCTGVGSKYTVTFTFENHESYALLGLTLVNLPAGVTAKPPSFALGGLLPGESVTLTTTISGAALGQTICFDLTTADPLHAGCEIEVCVTGPAFCPPVVDYLNLGFGGPGFAELDVFGDPAEPTGTLDLDVVLGPPSAPAWLVLGLLNLPTPLVGGTLVPVDAALVLPGATDPTGALSFSFPIASIPTVTLYAQAVMLDLTLPQLIGFSNALEVQVH